MTTNKNYDVVEDKIRLYKAQTYKLNKDKERLDEVCKLLKEARKDLSDKGIKENILALNGERTALKNEISALKKSCNKLYEEAEKMILDGLNEKYSEVYEKQLSRLYGNKIEIIVKNLGDDFDYETCFAEFVITTKNKKLNLKVLKTKSFGIKYVEHNLVTKKAVVEVCVYDKKSPVGTLLPFDFDMLGK